MSEAPPAVAPLRVGGGLLIVAGIGRAVFYLAPYEAFEIALAFSVVELIGWAGAFLAFFAAGYPSRRPAPRIITLVLAGIYVLSGLATIVTTVNPYVPVAFFALVGLLGLATFGLGITFAVLAVRTPDLSRRLAILPGVLYLGLIVFGLAAGAANVATAADGAFSSAQGLMIGGVSAIVPIVVGALVLAFGGRPSGSRAQNPR